MSPFPAVVSRLRRPHRARGQRAHGGTHRHSAARRRRTCRSATTTSIPRSGSSWPTGCGATAGRTTFGCKSSGRTASRSGCSPRPGSSPGTASPPSSPSSTTSASSSPPKRRSRPASAGSSAQSDALTALTARYTNPSERFDERLRSILEISARALRVERLSMWRFDDSARRHPLRGPVSLHAATATNREPFCTGTTRPTTSTRSSANASSPPTTPAPIRAPASSSTRYLDPERHRRHARRAAAARQHARSACSAPSTSAAPRTWTVDEQNFAIAVGNLIVVAIAEEERRSALARLAESEARARLIVDTAHDAFIGIDSAGSIVAWNAQAEATFGWTRDEVARQEPGRDDHPPGVSRGAHQRACGAFTRPARRRWSISGSS